MAGGPLTGIRMLAIEQFGAGPFASLYFADLGAEVIKIEDPATGGDVARTVPPGVAGDTSLYFETFNRGKRSIALDLTSDVDRTIFKHLVESADAVFNNLRGDLPDRLGLTYRQLGAINRGVVCGSLSAYGRAGPRAAEPGYDALIQAEDGWAAMTGEPDGPPIKSGLSMVDYTAGLAIAFGMLAAIYDARRTGIGCDVDTSLHETAISLLTYPATWWLSAGIESERQPLSAHPSIVPFQFFATADGYVAIACAKEKFFQRLCERLELNELAEDPCFGDFSERRAHRDEVLGMLSEVIRGKATKDLVELLRGAVPCAPVRSMQEALDADDLHALDIEISYQHDLLGTVATVGNPLRFNGRRYGKAQAPALDADGDALRHEIASR
jgi:crotonobetainyl-CoA:carnitine CoA-transferase CaiB-like acyl-CoA transferase